MRLFLLALLLACLPLSACVDANALTLDKMSVTLAGDSIHVRVPLSVPSEADSARITLTLTPGGSQTVKATPQATAVVFGFLAPAEGATVSFKACGIAYKKGVAGPNSCNSQQSYTRPITPPGAVTWPDSMTISQMVFPDAGSLALIAAAEADAVPAADSGLPWVRWAGVFWVLGDRGERTWQEVAWQALQFDTHPRQRTWWDATKACDCDVYLTPDLPYPPEYKA
jgi:hypothetical protein